MGAGSYVTETARAVPRQGLAGLVAVMLVIAGMTWGSRGLAMAVTLLLVGLGVGLVVLIVIARASIDSHTRQS